MKRKMLSTSPVYVLLDHLWKCQCRSIKAYKSFHKTAFRTSEQIQGVLPVTPGCLEKTE